MRLIFFGFGLVVLCAGLANPASAASVSAVVDYTQSGPGGHDLSAGTYGAAAPAGNSLVTPGGSGFAYAEIGLLRVAAFDAPIVVAQHIVNGTRTEATALWEDLITLTTSSAVSGVATFQLDLSATTSVSGARPNAGIASTDVVLAIDGVNSLDVSNVRGFPNVQDYRSVYQLGQGTRTDYGNFEINGVYSIDVPFVSGVAFALRVQSVCSASSVPEIAGFNPVGHGGASCNMTHTTRWGGLSRIVDGGGAPIGPYLATSQSGFDYIAQPGSTVPEPASWTMLVVGFALAGIGVRSRRARSAA